jgi:hypothetical protein
MKGGYRLVPTCLHNALYKIIIAIIHSNELSSVNTLLEQFYVSACRVYSVTKVKAVRAQLSTHQATKKCGGVKVR